MKIIYPTWPFFPDLSAFFNFFMPFQWASTRRSFHWSISASTRQAWSTRIPCKLSISTSLHWRTLKRFLGPSLFSISSNPRVMFVSQAQPYKNNNKLICQMLRVHNDYNMKTMYKYTHQCCRFLQQRRHAWGKPCYIGQHWPQS